MYGSNHTQHKGQCHILSTLLYLLSRKAYDTHKRLFYDGDTNQWIKKTCLTTEENRQELASTEQAIEECVFDFGGEEHDGGHVSEVGSPPPIVYRF